MSFNDCGEGLNNLLGMGDCKVDTGGGDDNEDEFKELDGDFVSHDNNKMSYTRK